MGTRQPGRLYRSMGWVDNCHANRRLGLYFKITGGMVLAHYIKQICSIAATMVLSGCFGGLTSASEDAIVAGWTLRIVEREGTCFVSYARADNIGELMLVPSPPCRFVSKTNSKPQTEHFGDGDERSILIVFGTPYTGKLPEYWKASRKVGCTRCLLRNVIASHYRDS